MNFVINAESKDIEDGESRNSVGQNGAITNSRRIRSESIRMEIDRFMDNMEDQEFCLIGFCEVKGIGEGPMSILGKVSAK